MNALHTMTCKCGRMFVAAAGPTFPCCSVCLMRLAGSRRLPANAVEPPRRRTRVVATLAAAIWIAVIVFIIIASA